MKRFIPYICVIVLVIITGFIIFPFFVRSSGSQISSCPSNLKQIALAIQLYSSDYEGCNPPDILVGKTVGWGQAIQPYLHTNFVFQCPSEQNPPPKDFEPNMLGFTDYWLNSNIAGMQEEKLKNEEQLIMLGDGDGGSPASTASYSIDRLPESWRTSSDSPAKRHLDGANYAFIDGHVKWLKPEQVSQLPASKKHPVSTFSIK